MRSNWTCWKYMLHCGLFRLLRSCWKVLKRATDRLGLFNSKEFHLKPRDSLHTFIFGDSYKTFWGIREATKNFHCTGQNLRELVWHASGLINLNLHYKQSAILKRRYRDAIASMYAHTDGGMDRPLFGEARPRVGISATK